jgi:hypothetical protein
VYISFNNAGVYIMATSIIDQIMELEAKKQELMARAKDEALKAAEKAVADLNNLGFHYRLIQVDGTATNRPAQATGTRSPRKGGVSDQVLAVIKASPDGLARAGVLAALNASDVKAEQSISNALSNLKKKGLLTAENGVYRAA